MGGPVCAPLGDQIEHLLGIPLYFWWVSPCLSVPPSLWAPKKPATVGVKGCRLSGRKRKSLGHRQTAANDPNRTLRAPRQELWYPPSNAMGRFNEAADPQIALAARAERPRVLRLHTDLKI